MGIIDDYYGGYENFALYTNEDGDVDFDAAYGTSCPWDDDQSDSEAASAALRTPCLLRRVPKYL